MAELVRMDSSGNGLVIVLYGIGSATVKAKKTIELTKLSALKDEITDNPSTFRAYASGLNLENQLYITI